MHLAEPAHVALQNGGVICYTGSSPSLQATSGAIVAHATAADVVQIVDTADATAASGSLAVRCTIDLLAVSDRHVALCGGGQVICWLSARIKSSIRVDCD